MDSHVRHKLRLMAHAVEMRCTSQRTLFGRTDDHIKTYNKNKNVNLELLNYAYIAQKYLSQAETNIKDFLATIEKPIVYEKFAELVAINPKHVKQINNQFKFIAQQYSGCVKDLVDKIEVLEQEIVAETLKTDNINNIHLLELKNKDMETDNINNIHQLELKNKDMELKNKDMELKNKDTDIENMKKIHLLELQNKNLEISQMNTELQNKKFELEIRDLKLQLSRKSKK